MKNISKGLLLVAVFAMALLDAFAQAAPKTWIVIGDSILSDVPGGTSSKMALQLVSAERNVIFKSLASPAAALGAQDHTGFNSPCVIDMIRRMGGYYSYYDGILIQAGTNDFGRSLTWESTVTSLYRILDHARAAGKKVMVMDPIWRADEIVVNEAGNTLNTYRFFMYLVCVNEYPDICTFASRSHIQIGTSAGSANYAAHEVATGTQLHPNAVGHRQLANWIKLEAAAAGLF